MADGLASGVGGASGVGSYTNTAYAWGYGVATSYAQALFKAQGVVAGVGRATGVNPGNGTGVAQGSASILADGFFNFVIEADGWAAGLSDAKAYALGQRVYCQPPPFVSCSTLAPDVLGVMRLYANGRLVATRELKKSGEQWRLPSGFKAEFWQIEFEARVKIYSVQMATSAKELKNV